MLEDEECGPLTDAEASALRNALINDKGPILERACIWLCLAFGCNPANFVLLREEDFIIRDFKNSEYQFYELKIPRIKKRDLKHQRSEFKIRKVDEKLAALLIELMNANKIYNPEIHLPRPLLMRSVPNKNKLGTPIEEFAYHLSCKEFTEHLQKCVARMNIISPRTGKPLTITPRRLRYTFATSMVRQGAAASELAELLDHSSLQYVQVYYNARSTIVERLDSALAEKLAPLVAQFSGKILNKSDYDASNLNGINCKNIGNPFEEPFSSFVKAFIRLRHEIGGQSCSNHMSSIRAFRYLFQELKDLQFNPILLTRDHFTRAEQAAKNREASSTAYRMGIHLNEISHLLDENRLTKVRLEYKTSLKRPESYDRLSLTANKRREKLMPKEEIFNALATISTTVVTPADKIRMCIIKILVFTGFRIGEVLTLPIDSLVIEDIKNSFTGHPELDNTGNKKNERANLKTLKSQVTDALIHAKNEENEAAWGANNWVNHNKIILENIEKALAVDNHIQTQTSQLISVNPSGKTIGEPL